MSRGPWTSAGCGIYRAVGEDAQGEYLASAAYEGDAAAIARKLNELQAQAPKRLVRSSAPRPKRNKPRRSERVHDADYLAWVRTQPCSYRAYDERLGNTLSYGLWHVCPKHTRIEAHHAGRRPMGRKCNDREAVPLCHESHDELTNLGWPKEQRRTFEAWAIAWTLARYAEQHPEETR